MLLLEDKIIKYLQLEYRKYYVYAYCDPRKPGKFFYGSDFAIYIFDFEPFYIGYGHNDRINDHVNLSALEKDGNKHKVNKIKQIIRETGKEPIRFIMQDYLTFDLANFIEEIAIFMIGRADKNRGPLTNMTDGGNGTKNIVYSEKERKRRSESQKNRVCIFNEEKDIEKHIKENEEIPEGFEIGARASLFKEKFKYVYNKDKDIERIICINDIIEKNFIEGRRPILEITKIKMRSSGKGKRWIYDPINNIQTKIKITDIILEGYIEGKRPISEDQKDKLRNYSPKGKTKKEAYNYTEEEYIEYKNKLSESMKGKKKKNIENYKGSKGSGAIYIHKITFDDGRIIDNILCLSEWCRNNNIDVRNIRYNVFKNKECMSGKYKDMFWERRLNPNKTRNKNKLI
jgi:hypothetical protein